MTRVTSWLSISDIDATTGARNEIVAPNRGSRELSERVKRRQNRVGAPDESRGVSHEGSQRGVPDSLV